MRGLGRSGDVDDVQRRVRRRLEPDEPRALLQVLFQAGRQLLGRKKREAVALRLVHLREHAVDAAVHVVDRDDVVARRQQVHERRRRAEARRERPAVGGALERRDALLQRGARRVRDAGVVVSLVDTDRLLHVGRGLVDRRGESSRRRVRLLPLVDRPGLEVHARNDSSTATRARAGSSRCGRSCESARRTSGAARRRGRSSPRSRRRWSAVAFRQS